MKGLLSLLVVANIIAPLTANAASFPSEEISIGVNDAYIPGGFGPDADAFAVISGTFPNSCYSWSRAVVADKSATFHEIRTMANVTKSMCLMVLVPYTKEIRLGKLVAGEHTLRFLNGDGTYFERTLNVE